MKSLEDGLKQVRNQYQRFDIGDMLRPKTGVGSTGRRPEKVTGIQLSMTERRFTVIYFTDRGNLYVEEEVECVPTSHECSCGTKHNTASCK